MPALVSPNPVAAPADSALGAAVVACRDRRGPVRIVGVVLALLVSWMGTANAQPDASPYEGLLVREVRVLVSPFTLDEADTTFVEPEARTEQIVRNQLRLRAGSEYRAEIARRDIARLNRLGAFRTVEHLVQPLSDGSVAAIYRLREQPIIRDVQVVGNRRLSDQKLAVAVDLLPGTPVDDQELARAARQIRELYRDRGYFNAEVTVDKEELAEAGIVLFRIREGARLRVTDLRIEGNEAFSDGRLRDELETEEAGIFVRGPLDREVVEADVSTLLRFYQDRGYLDARTDAEIVRSPDGREAIVTFIISEGRLYTLRDVIVEYVGEGTQNGRRTDGAPVLSRDQIVGLIGMKPGDTYSQSKADRALRTIRDAYGKLGHYRPARPDFGEFGINSRELRDSVAPEVDLLITVDEGPRLRTGEVIISGNELTRQSVIRRQVRLAPDRPLDTTRLQESVDRLTQTRLFALDPLSRPFAGLPLRGTSVSRGGAPEAGLGRDPGRRETIVTPDGRTEERFYRDVLIEVTETNTASLNFGASANSDQGIVGILSYNQRNFDTRDTPDSASEFFRGRSFRGGGQSFSVVAQPGNELQRYQVSLSDPAVRDSNISGSIAAFFSTREFDDFTEDRVGATLGLGRTFGETWVGRGEIRLQDIDLSDIEANSPTDFTDVLDKDLLTSVRLVLERTTVDNRLRPTEGTSLELSVAQAGALGGDFDFTTFNAEGNLFLPIAENDLGVRTVLRLRQQIGYIPQGQDAVPFYERFYLGGTSFRGIQFRDVSPKGLNASGQATGTPVGGTFLFFTGAELQQPLVDENIALAIFTDSGTVRESVGLGEYRLSVGVGLRLYLPQLSPAPLAFDFARALILEGDDDRNLFTFTVDLPF